MRFIGILGLALAVACQSGKTPTSTGPSIEMIAREQLGANLTSSLNQSQEYILFVQKADPSSLQPIRFMVMEVKTQQVVLQKDFKPGYVKWSGEYQVEWLDQPGIIQSDEPLSKYVQFATVRTQLH